MNQMFAVHMLNESGKTKAVAIAEAFDSLLASLVSDGGCGDGREFSICKTKLEEACFFAKKAMASKPENQAAK